VPGRRRRSSSAPSGYSSDPPLRGPTSRPVSPRSDPELRKMPVPAASVEDSRSATVRPPEALREQIPAARLGAVAIARSSPHHKVSWSPWNRSARYRCRARSPLSAFHRRKRRTSHGHRTPLISGHMISDAGLGYQSIVGATKAGTDRPPATLPCRIRAEPMPSSSLREDASPGGSDARIRLRAAGRRAQGDDSP
jgi:hypothetical protein